MHDEDDEEKNRNGRLALVALDYIPVRPRVCSRYTDRVANGLPPPTGAAAASTSFGRVRACTRVNVPSSK
jgi:hypothetical protein